jgi:adenylylsulfate kinase-like enzyme
VNSNGGCFDAGFAACLLDGDILRRGLCSDLGFSAADRRENIRRVGELAALFAAAGSVVICAFISPYRDDRDRIRRLLGPERFFEVYVNAPSRSASNAM